MLASRNVDLQTLYSVQGWDPYAWAFEAEDDHVRLVFKNPGMEDDPTCGPIIDDIAIKKLFTPDKPKGNHKFLYISIFDSKVLKCAYFTLIFLVTFCR